MQNNQMSGLQINPGEHEEHHRRSCGERIYGWDLFVHRGSRQRGAKWMCVSRALLICALFINLIHPGRYIGCWDLPGLICKTPLKAFELLLPRMDSMNPFCKHIETVLFGRHDWYLSISNQLSLITTLGYSVVLLGKTVTSPPRPIFMKSLF